MFFNSAFYGVFMLAAALFCRMLGVFIILPLAAPLVQQLPHGNAANAGLVLGGYGLTQALMQIPSGWLADRFGKKRVLLCALAVFALGGFAAAAADSVHGMIAGRLLQGAGAISAVSAAWVADIAPPAKRALAMAVFGSMIALAFVTALILAPLVAEAAGGGADGVAGAPGAAESLSGVFELCGWLGAVSLLLVAVLPPPAAERAAMAGKKKTADKMKKPLPRLKLNAALVAISAAAFVMHYALACFFLVLPAALPLPLAEYRHVYVFSFLLSLPPAVLLILRLDKMPQWCVPLALAAAVLGGFLLFALLFGAGAGGGAALTLAIAALACFFAGFAALEAAIPALAARAAPAELRATAMGVVMTCEFAGVFLGGAASGALTAAAGGGAALVVMLVMLLVLLVNCRYSWRVAAVV